MPVATRQFQWAGRLHAQAAEALAPVRLVAGLEALIGPDVIWVRGPELGQADEQLVQCVPWEIRYELMPAGRLRRAGHLLTEPGLPSGTWRSLTEVLQLRTPRALPPGRLERRIPIRLQPDNVLREPVLLEATSADWLRWAESAPAIRLRRLVFAMDASRPGVVVIRGTPLPPLPGRRFVEHDESLATPAGAQPDPPVSVTTLRAALGVRENELAVLDADGTWRRLPRAAWIPATRSAVRLALGGASDAG